MKVKLCEIFDLQMGKTPSRNELSFWNGNHKWISIGDLTQADKYIADTKECISDEGIIKSGIKLVPKNTVVMSFKLSIGKAAITAEDSRFPRAVDTLFFNHIVYFLCNQVWYESLFKPALDFIFPDGVSEARTYLERLKPIRNALSHVNPISVHQAEQAINTIFSEATTVKSVYLCRFFLLKIENFEVYYV